MKPMLPTLTFDLPQRTDWFYEVKYDGFRAILDWTTNGVHLTSRNGKDLLPQFPELLDFLTKYKQKLQPYLPLQFDGELVLLENSFKANFTALQVRGRLKSEKKIREASNQFPCRLMVFDLLMVNGTPLYSLAFSERKVKLKKLFQDTDLLLAADANNSQLLQYVQAYKDFAEVWENVILYDGEGIIAKAKQSVWEEGKRSLQWLKYKNWKYVHCFVTAYEKTNSYFYISVYKDREIYPIGQVLFGFKQEEKEALRETIKQNVVQEDQQFIFVEPAICLEVKYLEPLEQHQLREPHFAQFRFDLTPLECTYEEFVLGQKNLPDEIQITHPNKPLWERHSIQKADYLLYLREVAPYMLPFLKNRLLTVIRYPHGMLGDAFYQKNCPDYAPEFVETQENEGIQYIICNNLKTLLWLGNQLAIEFHIPFQTTNSTGPGEIVFDLDPPSKEEFHLAVRAAQFIKEVLDQLQLIGFIKTSGNKGLQIYLPLPENTYTYEETRLFTSFIAQYLLTKDPDSFTIERMKKKRGNRLYVDYLQHSEGKTIIAPYSLRGNEQAGVATPLFWEEIHETIELASFTMENALQRIHNRFDPFEGYVQAKQLQPFAPVLEFLKEKQKKG